MSILIKGMEMPKCGEKRIVITSSGYIEDASGRVIDGVEAVPIPPHGDLIDRDALRQSIKESIDECNKYVWRLMGMDGSPGRGGRVMNDCGNCRHTNHLGLPDWSTMPCAACARYGADNDPTMWEAKQQTNYDRIISKTPEELADFMIGAAQRGGKTTNSGSIRWLDWLKQEAGE